MTKSLVIYFSMTNNTKKVAEMIAQELGADTYRIQAKQPYTSEDLNWHNNNSRANREQEDNNSRPEFAGQLPDLTKYDRILIGHPTWWEIPPRIINTVIEKLDLSGKEIATFSTSGGSTYDQAQKVMNELIGSDVKPGRVLSSKKDVENWLRDINFK
ncbi:flavodoxin [Ligilactobacillus salivarius]|uniref:flavodoxin n=1 Tax=Ligilactobacillus salivarius TaxID=1624 RepID=UPI00136E4976|nr:flavodoxin [Ligilactobacillus salivarius]MYY53175.1 flavodoxin [Ligilactobacillus salivarius]